MKKKNKIWLSLSATLALMGSLLLTACNDVLINAASVGTPYEVLVVCNDTVWNAPAGRALFRVLDSDVPALPQSEPAFKITHVTPANFGRLFKTFRSIVQVEIGPAYTQPKFKFRRDEYASPQMILIIQAPDELQFGRYVTDNAPTIIDFFTNFEMNQQIKEFAEKYSLAFKDTLKKHLGVEMNVPAEIQAMKVRDNFVWASNTYSNNGSMLNYVVYTYPYRDADTFTRDYFVRKRDSVMALNIPGAEEGQHVMTDTLLMEVADRSLRGGEMYMQQVRGLWKMKNGFMGGPFVSHSVVDELNGRVIVAETFVFAPENRKRNIIRRLQAALYTLLLPIDKERGNATFLPEVVVEQETTN